MVRASAHRWCNGDATGHSRADAESARPAVAVIRRRESTASGAGAGPLPPGLGAIDVEVIVVVGSCFGANDVRQSGVLAERPERAAQKHASFVWSILAGAIVAGDDDRATFAGRENADVDGVTQGVLAQLASESAAHVAAAVGAERGD
jgi:hypothetical protein